MDIPSAGKSPQGRMPKYLGPRPYCLLAQSLETQIWTHLSKY